MLSGRPGWEARIPPAHRRDSSVEENDIRTAGPPKSGWPVLTTLSDLKAVLLRKSSDLFARGTDGSNPPSPSEDSAANPESLDQAVLISGGPQVKRRRVRAPGPDRPHVIASDDRAAAPKSKQSKLRVQPGRRPGRQPGRPIPTMASR